MKKYIIYFITFINLCVLFGCGSASIKNENIIYSVMQNLYSSNFTYIKSDISYRGDEQQKNIYVGELTAIPYVEHVSAKGKSLWQEVYYYGEGKEVHAKIKVDGNWQEQNISREYFFGYEENITIIQEQEKNIEGVEYIVYNTEYTISVGEKYHLSESLNATVLQEYYLEKQSGKLKRIVTDLSNLQKTVYIANNMSASGTTLENAQQNANNVGGFDRIVDIWIQYEDKDFQIEIP